MINFLVIRPLHSSVSWLAQNTLCGGTRRLRRPCVGVELLSYAATRGILVGESDSVRRKPTTCASPLPSSNYRMGLDRFRECCSGGQGLATKVARNAGIHPNSVSSARLADSKQISDERQGIQLLGFVSIHPSKLPTNISANARVVSRECFSCQSLLKPEGW